MNFVKRLTKAFKPIDSNEVPVFMACDDGYVKYLMVALRSLIEHTTADYKYHIIILNTGISVENQNKVLAMSTWNVKIEFENVSEGLESIKAKLPLRDYYSLTTYFRFLIADMYPEYNKAIYIDSDTILMSDIADLYNHNLGDNYIGAIKDYLIQNTEVFSNYSEKVLGISSQAYFNAGVVVLNLKQFRKKDIKKRFLKLLETYSFVVAQDQDYLNILCQNNVLWIKSSWNVQMSETKERELDDINIIHYNFASKPWNDDTVRYAKYFWKYARTTADYKLLCDGLASYKATHVLDNEHVNDSLTELANKEIEKKDNYLKKYLGNDVNKTSRQDILKKIEEYEKNGRFDEDVEEDPPGRMLMPDEIDYLRDKWKNRIKAKYSFKIARWFMNEMIAKKQLIINEIKGIENLRTLDSGAVLTCNHFNPMDSFAMHIVYDEAKQPTRKLFRVIKEGNYTSFPGFYGYLMRNCNTLPLSSNHDTMKKFMKAVDEILTRGHYVLIYPEQSLWWNYKKPKPLKKGGFTFAARNNVPVVPVFITMEDSNVPGEGGLPVQEYTIHVLKPIFPDKTKSKIENAKIMMDENYRVWKDVYEEFYGIPLTYTCDDEVK